LNDGRLPLVFRRGRLDRLAADIRSNEPSYPGPRQVVSIVLAGLLDAVLPTTSTTALVSSYRHRTGLRVVELPPHRSPTFQSSGPLWPRFIVRALSFKRG